jgi:hypothetical protein
MSGGEVMTSPEGINRYIWERLPDESERAYRAFSVYLEFGLGNRSFTKVLQKLGKKGSYIKQLQRWSSRHSWVARVTAYDQHTIEQHRERHFNERLQMYKEHTDIYARMRSIGFEGLKKRLETDLDSITTHQLFKIVKNAMEIERLSHEGLLTASISDSAEREWLETPLIELVQDDPEAYEHFKALEEVIKRRSKKAGSVKHSLIYGTS